MDRVLFDAIINYLPNISRWAHVTCAS